MRQTQSDRPACRRLVSAISLLLIFISADASNLGAVRHSQWGIRRNCLAHNPHRLSLLTSSLALGERLRGGAEASTKEKESKKKESKEDEDKEWAELVESETIKEDDSEETKEESSIEGDEEEEEEEKEEEEDEYDMEEEEAEEEEEEESTAVEEANQYDDVLVASPMMQLYASLGVMFLSKKVDLYNPLWVRAARFAFISYLVVLQLFLLFVRIRAKAADDRTPVTTTNPLSNLVQSQLSDNNAMMKNLASSFLKSQSTILEYDLQQAKSMQGGLLFNMAFMWFLHFKMNQIQPLLIQTATGLLNLAYSPLFQAYVLGRNLERPFPNPQMKKMQDLQQEAAATEEETTIDDEETTEEEEEATAESNEESADEEEEEDGEDKEDSDDEESDKED